MVAERKKATLKQLAVGAGAGVIATFAVGAVDKLLSKLISDRQKEREQSVREGSPHEVAGKKIGQRLLGRMLSQKEEKVAQILFSTVYGLIWGTVFTGIRRLAPRTSRFLSAPYGVGFFFACDGVIAPLAQMSPPIYRIPWAFNAKEVTNHIVWNVVIEEIIRLSEDHSKRSKAFESLGFSDRPARPILRDEARWPDPGVSSGI